MVKGGQNQYQPDYVVSPGVVLEDYLDSNGMTQAELADRMGCAKKTVNAIIKGKAPITPSSALKLERIFNRPAHFWNNLEQYYQEDRARLAARKQHQQHLEWLTRFPIRQMIKLGFIREFKDKADKLQELLSFLGIASPEQWQKVWEQHQVAYRQQSQRFECCAEAVSAWLRQGEIQAQRTTCAAFDKRGFQDVLEELRAFTREPPELFQPRLIELCAQVGVAVVFVPDLPKTGVSGATRWLGSKAVIQLSLRYKSNDHLWFTLFHEAGHIIKHGRKDIFLEGNGLDDEKEAEANDFARDKLIPPGAYRRFLTSITSSRPTLAEIGAFADEIGIAPGIVVGRLQHDGTVPHNVGNSLKVRYRWQHQANDT